MTSSNGPLSRRIDSLRALAEEATRIGAARLTPFADDFGHGAGFWRPTWAAAPGSPASGRYAIALNQWIAQVCTISANGERAIGELIADSMERVGHAGVIKAEDGRGMSNELEIVEGLQFDRGHLSPYFINEPEKQRTVLDDVYVLLHEKPVGSIRELLPILEEVTKQSRPLLIVAEDVTGEAFATLVVNAVRGILNDCAVKTPGFGDAARCCCRTSRSSPAPPSYRRRPAGRFKRPAPGTWAGRPGSRSTTSTRH